MTSLPTPNPCQPVRAGYVGPYNGGDPEGRSRRSPARTRLDESYEQQVLVWRANGLRLLLAPTSSPPDERPGHPWGGTVLLITAWNAHGAACTLAQNDRAQQQLVSDVERAGGTLVSRAHAVPPERDWVEELLVVSGLDDDSGLDLARRAGQAAIVRVDDDVVRVVPTRTVAAVARSSRPWTLSARPETCPMRLDDVADAPCVVHGGPWTSRSIHAAALWQTHRDLLAPRLGCAVCHDATRPVAGPGGGRGAIMLEPMKLGSRHGGYVW